VRRLAEPDLPLWESQLVSPVAHLPPRPAADAKDTRRANVRNGWKANFSALDHVQPPANMSRLAEGADAKRIRIGGRQAGLGRCRHIAGAGPCSAPRTRKAVKDTYTGRINAA
jgi:hypothetical protein